MNLKSIIEKYTSRRKYIPISYVESEVYKSKVREKNINDVFGIRDVELDKWLDRHLPYTYSKYKDINDIHKNIQSLLE